MCWKCEKNTVSSIITRSSECPVCGTDLHSCLNCKFYDKTSHYECRETVDELVKDKEKANFCDYFSEKIYDDKNSSNSGSSNSVDKKQAAKDAFNSLFGGL